MEDEDFEPCELAEEKDEGGFKAPLPDNEDAASDASMDSEGEDFENVPRRFRTDSESTTDTLSSVSSSYSVGSNISTVSRLSMLSSGSTIASGGIFKEDEKEVEPNPEGPKSGPDMSRLKDIKHKQKRTDMYLNLLRQKRRQKMKERKQRKMARLESGEKAEEKKTIESMRKFDETTVEPDDAEVDWEEQNDELSDYFNNGTVPKILIMTRNAPKGPMVKMCHELLKTIPNSQFFFRQGFALKKIIPQAIKKGFTAMIVVSADRKWVPNDLKIIYLPGGPTAHFKMSSVRLREKTKGGDTPTTHLPELILNNFKSRLGRRIGRMFAALFPQVPEFEGRQVVTFHNQRDYIFFRQHRYIFRSEKRAGLKELGPRFTLKLRSLQKGTFDSKYGEFEYEHRRKEMDTEGHGYSKKKFFL
ncbi:unnamed protein product [Oikopleura dioica]|uniref:Ribosome production factor 1 n=3 Tax=Oikopleura dioica TaxID=34765 RepID=E4X1C8_OIKDI|nr:unnamed protein product [Oikopleura dioica]